MQEGSKQTAQTRVSCSKMVLAWEDFPEDGSRHTFFVRRIKKDGTCPSGLATDRIHPLQTEDRSR